MIGSLPGTLDWLRVVSGSQLHVREAPHTRSAVLESLDRGSTVLELRKQGEWLRVRGNSGREGWVAARYLCTSPQPKTPPILEAAAPTEVGEVEVARMSPQPSPTVETVMVGKGKTVWVPKRWLNLRGAPGGTGRVLAKLQRGDALEVLKSGPEWMQVRSPQGQEGWVLARLTCPEAVTPEVQDPGPNQVGVVMNPGLRLRVKPHHQGKVIASMERGTNLWITQEQGGWLKAADDVGRVGWTAARFICSPPLTPIPSLHVARPDPIPAIAPSNPALDKVSAVLPEPVVPVSVFSFKL